MSNKKTRIMKYIPLLSASILFLNFIIVENCSAKDINYKVSTNPDGGYTMEIEVNKTTLFTADGFLKKENSRYTINLTGKGENWSYRDQKGFFYSPDKISCKTPIWDIGYAWVDTDRKHIYLNLYWVSYPDGMRPSDVNGKYEIVKD